MRLQVYLNHITIYGSMWMGYNKHSPWCHYHLIIAVFFFWLRESINASLISGPLTIMQLTWDIDQVTAFNAASDDKWRHQSEIRRALLMQVSNQVFEGFKVLLAKKTRISCYIQASGVNFQSRCADMERLCGFQRQMQPHINVSRKLIFFLCQAIWRVLLAPGAHEMGCAFMEECTQTSAKYVYIFQVLPLIMLTDHHITRSALEVQGEDASSRW